MEPIIVIDSIMGSGKTRWAIKHMLDHHKPGLLAEQSHKWLYITVTLDEVARIQEACRQMRMQEPVQAEEHKYTSFLEMVYRGDNIVSTHALFRYLTKETVDLLKERGYTLIIDETFNCVEPWNKLTKKERHFLEKNEVIKVNSGGGVRWNKDHPDLGKGNLSALKGIKNLIENGNLMLVNDRFFLWHFPVEFLAAFKNVYVLTYLFEGSVMRSYLKARDTSYVLKTIRNGGIADYNAKDTASDKTAIWELIKLVEDPRLNKVGNKRGKAEPLSSAWFERECKGGPSKAVKELQLNTANFFRKIAGTRSKRNMWACKKSIRKYLGGDGYQRGFVNMNERATNNYMDKAACAYLANRFLLKPLREYFTAQEIEFREDLFALCELIQWVWRSRIREDGPIDLYIPSERMRRIFKNWLRYNDVEITGGRRLDVD